MTASGCGTRGTAEGSLFGCIDPIEGAGDAVPDPGKDGQRDEKSGEPGGDGDQINNVHFEIPFNQ